MATKPTPPRNGGSKKRATWIVAWSRFCARNGAGYVMQLAGCEVYRNGYLAGLRAGKKGTKR